MIKFDQYEIYKALSTEIHKILGDVDVILESVCVDFDSEKDDVFKSLDYMSLTLKGRIWVAATECLPAQNHEFNIIVENDDSLEKLPGIIKQYIYSEIL